MAEFKEMLLEMQDNNKQEKKQMNNAEKTIKKTTSDLNTCKDESKVSLLCVKSMFPLF